MTENLVQDEVLERLQALAQAKGLSANDCLNQLLTTSDRGAVLERLFQVALDMLIVAGMDGYFKLWNPALERVLGYSADELRHTPFIEWVHPDDRAVTLHMFERARQHHPVVAFENRYRCRDGSYRWFSWRSHPNLDPNTIYAVARDITEQRANETALMLANRRLITTLESITDAFFSVDMLWNFTYVNGEAERLLLRPREELVGRSLWDEFPEATHSDLYPYFHHAMTERVTVDFRTYYAPLLTWFEIKVYPSEQGLLIYFRNVDQQIIAEHELRAAHNELEQRVHERTLELEQAAVKLRESQERFANIVNLAADPIMNVDEAGTILLFNHAACEVFGYDEDEIVGQSVALLTPDRFQNILSEQLQSATRISDPTWRVGDNGSLHLRHKDGHDIPMEAAISRQHENGHIIYTVILRDVTQQRQLEAELRANWERERELNAFRSNFIAMVSHEFRTPMAVILTNSELLRRYWERIDPTQRDERLNRIKAYVLHLTRLVESALAVHQAELQGFTLRPAPVDMIVLAHNIIEELQPLYPGHHLQASLPPTCGPLRLDEQLVQLLLINLLSNAVKYSSAGQRVELRVECQPDGVRIIVQDYGIGIPEAEQERLFDAFYRASNALHLTGTGLGLTVVRQVVQAHGGQIDLHSEVGSGTRFTVWLPTQTD